MGSRYEKSPAVQMVLKSAPLRFYNKTISEMSEYNYDMSSTPQITETRTSLVNTRSTTDLTHIKEGCALLRDLTEAPSQALLQTTIKNLLDVGQIEAAKRLGEELPTPPIEQYLVDTSLAIIHTCGAPGTSFQS